MTFLPFTRLRPRGVGTTGSVRSRATDVVRAAATAVGPRFRFSIDTAWAVAAAVDADRELAERLSQAASDGHIAVGLRYAGIDWVTDPECVLRDLESGQRVLESLGVEPRSVHVVARTAAFAGLFREAGLRVVADGPVAGAIDLSSHGDLGLKALAANAVSKRDAERALEDVREPVPMGGDLWRPTASLVDGLHEWADEIERPVRFVTWDEVEAAGGDGEGAADPGYREAAMAGVHDRQAAVSRALLRTERILAMSRLLGDNRAETDALEDAWCRHLEDLAGDYVGTGSREKQAHLVASCDEVSGWAARAQAAAENRIAASVDAGTGPDGIVPLVVFNPSAHPRSEAVEADVVYYGEHETTRFDRYEFYRIVDADGMPVAVEEISGKQVETAEIRVRFVARDVPALGYRAYYLVPKPPADAGGMPIQAPGEMMPDFPEPSFAIRDVEERVSEPRRGLRLGRTFTTDRFAIDVDEVTGQVGIADRQAGQLIDSLRIEAREDGMSADFGRFSPTGRVFAASVDRVDLAESGEVSAVVAVSGRILASPVELRLRVYDGLPFMDVEADVSWRDQVPALVELAASLADGVEVGRCDAPFGAGKVDRQATALGRWLSADAGGSVVTLVSDRADVRLTGKDVRIPMLLSTPDPASYAYNEVWPSYPDRVTYHVRLSVGIDPSEGSGHLGEPLTCRPVYDRSAPRTRPSEGSSLPVTADGVRVSSIRPAGDTVRLRAHGVGRAGQLRAANGMVLAGLDLLGRETGERGAVIEVRAGDVKTIDIEAGT